MTHAALMQPVLERPERATLFIHRQSSRTGSDGRYYEVNILRMGSARLGSK